MKTNPSLVLILVLVLGTGNQTHDLALTGQALEPLS